jgi:D-alanine-D-alanine ligase
MSKKINVAILFGGRSPEHNISLLSARNVIDQIDRELFNPILIGIDKKGKWHLNEGSLKLLHADDPNRVELGDRSTPVLISQNTDEHTIIAQSSHKTLSKIDAIFPVLHGTYGEDGSIQGFAKLANIPCVGCGILGSAIGMDKDVSKRLLRDSGIAVADFITVRKHVNDNLTYAEASEKLGKELFLKPANLGSSVGVSLARNEVEFNEGLRHGLEYDPKVIIEEKVIGRELECAVLGNMHPEASTIGEVLTHGGWYSFENKYVDDKGSQIIIPAEIDLQTLERCRVLAIRTYKMLECEGMARVDMFLRENGELLINEINTIPGFTDISMYPQLWKASGIPYKDLITKLIHLAIEAQGARNTLRY